MFICRNAEGVHS